MKRTRRAVGILLAVMMLLGLVPAVSAAPQRDAALDDALNYEGYDYTFTTYVCRGGSIDIVTEGDRTYAVLSAADEDQGDNTTWIKTHVVAKKDDYFCFDHASSLDYMEGATVSFGYVDDYGFVELYSNEDEGGDGVYDGETVDEWELFYYQIPWTGEYDFMWRIDAYSNDSRFAIDDVFLSPQMTIRRAMNAENSALYWTNDSDHPWQPAYSSGRLCMKSGAISHNESTSLVSDPIILREGDVFSADIATDSESGYDKLNVYYTRTSDENPTETRIQSYSGTGGSWVNYLSWPVPEDGMYSFRFEYKKDSSVSLGSDTVFVCNAYARKMGLAHAAAPGFEDRIEFNTYFQENLYPFTPTFRDGEIMLTSTNQGEPSSHSVLLFAADLTAGESIAFDYSLDSEDNYDYLRLTDNGDGTEYFTCKSDTNGFVTYSFFAEETGEYVFRLDYSKDGTVNQGEDTALLKNFRIIPDGLNEAMRREDETFLTFTRGMNGGQIELIDDGARYYAQVSDYDSFAVASASAGYHNAYEYVIFDYKVEGDDAKLEFWAYDGCENEFYDDGSGEWHTYYYRLPASDSTPLDWFFEPGQNGTVCVDNVYVGYMNVDFSEALNHPDTDSEANPISIENFIGTYDPLEPRGITKYVYADPEAGHSSAFEWAVEACAGDYYEFVFCFFDEDGVPNASSFCVYQDGVLEADWSDEECGVNKWWKLTTTFTSTSTHVFRIEFYSEGSMGGDGFAVSRAKLEAIGVTLDEALNVYGGTIHFSDPHDGGFIPCYDTENDCYVGCPSFVNDPASEVELEYSFETSQEVNLWERLDADNNGYTFGYGDPSTYTGVPAAFGDSALMSGPMFEGAGLSSSGVDNWAISPTFTVPEGCISGGWFTFMYAAADPDYPELFEIYVLPEGDVDRAVLMDSLTAYDKEWDNFGYSLYQFDGQEIAIGFRHCSPSYTCGLLIDSVYIGCAAPHYAELTFTKDLRTSNRISFNVRVQDFNNDGEIEGNISGAVFEDGRNIYNFDGRSLFSYYGEDWETIYLTAPANSGTHTYRVVLSWNEDDIPDFNIYLDDFRISSTASPISYVEILDYAVPAAGTAAGDNYPTVPEDRGYDIALAAWYGEDETVLGDDDLFEAGGKYTLLVKIGADDDHFFPDELTLYVENDPNAEIVYQTSTELIIGFTQVTIPAAGLPGDVNCDGQVTMADLSALSAYMLGKANLTPEGLANADVNGDGKVNAMDLPLIYQLTLAV